LDNKPIVIHVSFKRNNDLDMELYNWLNNKSSKSGYIKDVLKLAMENELNKKD